MDGEFYCDDCDTEVVDCDGDVCDYCLSMADGEDPFF